MAHIPDGVLSLPVLIGGGVVAAMGLGLALRAIDDRSIPRIDILAGVFFAASLVSVPMGPSSVHLLLAGLMGLMLGPGIFPAVLVALVLQAVLFGFGGLTTLGINTVTTKLTAFAIGAMFGGFAGSFFAARQGFVSPESFVFLESAVILAIVVLGGMGSLTGIAVAAVVMVGGTELLREMEFLKHVFGPDFTPELYRMLIFGMAMVVVMLFKPRGFVGSRQPTAFLKESKAVSGSFTKEGHG